MFGYFMCLFFLVISGLLIGWAAKDLEKKKYTDFGLEVAFAIGGLLWAIHSMFFIMRGV